MRSARTSASASTAYVTIGHGLTAAIRATRGSSKFSTATTVRRQRGHELALRPRHALEVTEELDVRHRNARDDADIRAADRRQATDVACPAGAHLQDDPLDIVRRIQERQGEPELIVERPLAGGHPEGRREAGLQQILGRRLADRARDADHPALHALARQDPELQQRQGGVRYDDRRAADGLSLCEVGGGSTIECVADELVSVAFGDDGNVELPGQHRPRVDARPRRR